MDHRDLSPGAGETVSRTRMRQIALAAVTAVGIYFCYRLAEPFLPALTWAAALAILTFPIHSRIRRVVPSANWAAGLSLTIVLVLIVGPTVWVGYEMAKEAGRAGQLVREQAETGQWKEAVAEVPYLNDAAQWVEANVNISESARDFVNLLTRGSPAILSGSLWAAFQALVLVFVLFYCFRDRDRLLGDLQGLIPLPTNETERVFGRVADSVNATLFGTVVAALIQGVSGGLLFWAVGVPAPVLWGVVMFVLGIVPLLGAVLVWVPAAALLISNGQYLSAILVVTWGLLMAGPIGNFVYARCAGDRMRMHPVAALIAYVGGLAVFGATGMVLGPAILVVTFELIEVWRRRAARSPANGRADGIPELVVR
ncbi:MAG TPA: AI-2E family transporter [Gemmataceae bacterium]|nr:AI-2E family transporter [Gemmataceae bacterium]